MRLNKANAGIRSLGSPTLCSKASTKTRALSVMKSEYSCSRWKTFLASRSRRS
jgi:hypothetical protein